MRLRPTQEYCWPERYTCPGRGMRPCWLCPAHFVWAGHNQQATLSVRPAPRASPPHLPSMAGAAGARSPAHPSARRHPPLRGGWRRQPSGWSRRPGHRHHITPSMAEGLGIRAQARRAKPATRTRPASNRRGQRPSTAAAEGPKGRYRTRPHRMAAAGATLPRPNVLTWPRGRGSEAAASRSLLPSRDKLVHIIRSHTWHSSPRKT